MYSVLNAQTCNMGESLFPSNFHLVMIRKRQKSYKCKRDSINLPTFIFLKNDI